MGKAEPESIQIEHWHSVDGKEALVYSHNADQFGKVQYSWMRLLLLSIFKTYSTDRPHIGTPAWLWSTPQKQRGQCKHHKAPWVNPE